MENEREDEAAAAGRAHSGADGRAVGSSPELAAGSCKRIAAAIANEWTSPLLVLDADDRILLANVQLQRLIGRSAAQLEGRLFRADFTTAEADEQSAPALAAARSGVASTLEQRTHRADGNILRLTWSFTAVNAGGDGTLLGTVTANSLESSLDEVSLPGDENYEISVTPENFGIIRRVWGSRTSPGVIGQRCYTVLHGLPSPCLQCSAPSAAATGATATGVIPSEQGDHYRVVFAESSGPTTVRLRVRRFEKQTLRLLSAARIEEIAARSSLSVREVEVLRMLIDGASSAEIAAKLGISEHTVKFHRTNVLTKVGADSRADLLRLFL